MSEMDQAEKWRQRWMDTQADLERAHESANQRSVREKGLYDECVKLKGELQAARAEVQQCDALKNADLSYCYWRDISMPKLQAERDEARQQVDKAEDEITRLIKQYDEQNEYIDTLRQQVAEERQEVERMKNLDLSACILQFRRDLRQLLWDKGVPNNPGFTENDIVYGFREIIEKLEQQAEAAEQLKCDACDGSGQALSGPCGCHGKGVWGMVTTLREMYQQAAERQRRAIERAKAEVPYAMLGYVSPHLDRVAEITDELLAAQASPAFDKLRL